MSYNLTNADFKVAGFPSISVLSTTTGIDGTVATTTNLFTVPTGRKAVIVGAVIRPTTVTGFTTVGTAGVGIAAGEADIFPAIALTGLSTTTSAFTLLNSNLVFAVGQSTNIIKLGIDVGYVATVATLSLDLLGYLL